jgi:branched-chain amino acid transport system substrate-binding protein
MNLNGKPHRCAPFLCIWTLFIAAFFSFGNVGCQKEQKPIKLGFVGCLTGRLSDLGTSGRNGVLLAVEQVNGAGGIKGRPIELIIKDDQQDKKKALEADEALIEEGVVAIIGHMTSAMSMAAVPLMNRKKVLMVSPTTSTDALEGMDDYFIRVLPPNSAETDHLAYHAVVEMGIRDLSAVYGLANRAYTEKFVNNFAKAFEQLGGKVVLIRSFGPGEAHDFSELAESLMKPDPDAILLVAGALDAAMICQHIRMLGSAIPIFSSGWAMTDDFIEQGGPTVDGVVFSQLIDVDSQTPSYLAFVEAFESRFGDPPDFAACHGYEAARMIIDALKKNPDPQALKETILKQKRFPGVQGEITLDPYGDPKRERFLIRVKNGRFQRETALESPSRAT